MNFVHYFAQIGQNPSDMTAGLLFVYGPLGIGWFYFMWKEERRANEQKTQHHEICSEIRTLSHRMTGLSKTLILDVLSRDKLGENTRRIAEELLEKNTNGHDHQ